MAIGASAFIWYWTRLYDFETSELWVAFGYSIMGVGGLMIVVCLWIEDRPKEKRKSKVIIKKRIKDMKTCHRIVKDSYFGFEVQIKRWWFPFWIQASQDRRGVNSFTSIDKAKEWIDSGCKNEVWRECK